MTRRTLSLFVLLLASPQVLAQWKQLYGDVPSSPRFGTPSDQPHPLNRAAHSLVAYQDSLYVFGGVGDTNVETDHEFDDTWRFDLLNDRWIKIISDRDTHAVSPPHRFHQSTALHTNVTVAEMIVFGGLSITQKPKTSVVANEDLVVTQFNDVWRLSVDSEGQESWHLDANMTTTGSVPTARSEAAAVVHDGQLYIFGGIAYDEIVDASPTDYGDLWRYDLSSCVWTQIIPSDGVVPPARFSHTMIKFTTDQGETFLLVFSGRHLELPSWSLLGDTWIFSLTTFKWTMLQSTVPLQRAYTSAVATSGPTPKMWFFGGYYRPKQGSSGYVYDDLVGGYILPGTSATTPTSIQFYHGVFEPDDAVPPLRYNHRAVLWRDTMIIHGGSYQSQRGDLWQFNLTNSVMQEDAAAALPVNMSTLVYVLAGFVFSIVVVLVILIIRWRRIDRRNLELARMRGVSTAARGLPRERLDQMEVIKYKKSLSPPTSPPSNATTPSSVATDTPSNDDPDHNNDDICPICLIEFEEDEDVRNLTCKHLFHVSCIDEWLGRNTTCPMCKNNFDLEVVNVEIVGEPTTNTRSRQAFAASPMPIPVSMDSLASTSPPSPSIATAQRGGAIVTPVLTGPS